MYARKNQIPKSQLPEKCKFVEHYFHTKSKTERKWNSEYIQVVSIDPAVKNLAIRIERWNKNKKVIPIYFNKLDLLKEQKENNEEEDFNFAFKSLFKLMKELESLFKQSHVFVIERQLPVNYKPVRISQHIITFIAMSIYNNDLLASIYEVDPKLKGEMFGAGKLGEKELKDWAVQKALELLKLREDNDSLDVMKLYPRKQDDLADTIMQTCALFRHILNLTERDNLWEYLNIIFNEVLQDNKGGDETPQGKITIKINK
jgi:hypothetical protein